MREEMDKRSLFSAMRPPGPMEGGERLAVPKPGPGTRRAAGKWPGDGRHHGRAPCPRSLHPTFLLFERDTSFTGSAGSVTLSPNPQHQFSPPHSPAPKGQLPRGTTAWLGEQPPRSGASGPLWLLQAVPPQGVLREQGSAQSFLPQLCWAPSRYSSRRAGVVT